MLVQQQRRLEYAAKHVTLWLEVENTYVVQAGLSNAKPQWRCPSVQGALARQVELAPIQQLLPDEMMALVLSHLPSAYALGAVACVCRNWRDAAQNPTLWRTACARTFPELQHDALARLVRANHRCAASRCRTRCYSQDATWTLPESRVLSARTAWPELCRGPGCAAQDLQADPFSLPLNRCEAQVFGGRGTQAGTSVPRTHCAPCLHNALLTSATVLRTQAVRCCVSSVSFSS